MSASNKQDDLKTIKNRTAEIFKSQRLSDCSFRVGSTTKKSKVFKAHKLILSMASPVFEAMFYGELAEKKYPIDVTDIEPKLFANLLEFIYTDQININTFEDAIDTCYAAQKYLLTPVVDHCVEYIKNKLSVSNVCRAYEFANFFEKEELTESCIKLIKSKINSILYDPSFLEININTLKDICHMDDLNLDTELSLFNALERYYTKRLEKDDCEEYDVLRELLKTIRFLSMTPKQFADGPGISKLLQQDEKFSILMTISSGDVKNMPDGFTTNKSCRNSYNGNQEWNSLDDDNKKNFHTFFCSDEKFEN